MTDSENQLSNQQETISDLESQLLSTHFNLPLLKIAEGVLMVPLVGSIDSVKSQKVMEDVLNNIRDEETQVTVLDIAGIKVVDSAVAAHLIKIVTAARLMGCRVILSGISPVIAQNIVNLGMDVSLIESTNTLKDALVKAYRMIGYTLVKNDG